MTTFDDALAACVGRWGSPTGAMILADAVHAEWATAGALVSIVGDVRAVTLTVVLTGAPLEADVAAWTLSGEPTADAPAATLPDALDLADAWLRERDVAIGGAR